MHVSRLLGIVCALTLAGCMTGRFGVIQVRLPAELRSGIVDVKLVDIESPRAVALVQNILREHGLVPADPSKPYHGAGVMIPMQAFTHPQTLEGVDPDVHSASSWVLVVWKPHDVPDKIVCTIEPPARGDVLEILVKLEYAGRESSPLARSLYTDLTRQLTEHYGSDRVQATKF
jgi:hypothetical protein